jgi:predicted small secreted protein
MHRPRLVFAGLTLAALALAGCSSGAGAGSTASSTGGASAGGSSAPKVDHAEDVAITACAPNADTNWVSAKVTITNHSSKASNYIVTVAFETADGKTQIDTGLAAAQSLAPNQQTVQDAVGTKDAVPGYTCRVTEITRLAA